MHLIALRLFIVDKSRHIRVQVRMQCNIKQNNTQSPTELEYLRINQS